jgi:putative ATP-binding cassette transporter
VYLIELLKAESEGQRRAILLTIVVSGLANAAMLGAVNSAASNPGAEGVDARLIFLFVIALLTYYFAMHYVFARNTAIFENLIDKLRVRLCEKIRDAELNEFEQIDRNDLYNRLTQDTTIISESQGIMTASLQATVLVIFVAGYMAILSWAAFLLTLALVAGGLVMFYLYDQEIREVWGIAARAENDMLGLVSHVVDGFRQVKSKRARATHLLHDVAATSNRVKRLKAKSYRLVQSQYIFSQCFFFLLVGAVAFLVPKFASSFVKVLPELVASTLFVIGPLSLFMLGIPAYSKSDMAAQRIKDLEERLDSLNAGDGRRTAPPSDAERSAKPVVPRHFRSIRIEQLRFIHRTASVENGETAFPLGPIDVSIEAGDLVYILGGNGSGKSTFLTLLAGLYIPDSGSITVDSILVGDGNIAEYRELFSTIFAGHHLFDKLYGQGPVSQETIDGLLNQLGLSRKTQFRGGRFTNTRLSTGQMKRLALLTCILEDSPVFLFDELAADQDPEFKSYLYRQLIPQLHAAGKTIVAVTHDEDFALESTTARIFRMNYGQLLVRAATNA